ncbi:MAG: NUDIX hydrolase [Clostridiales bacterium]|nr:NUDIX hydrolase [Clostridiales bacterium]
MIDTEEEFLKNYDPSKYRHPSVAVDCVVFRASSVLLVRRGGHPFRGKLALPGGFIEEGESAEQAVRRELKEETDLEVKNLRQFGFASTPGRDPRDWNISLVFTAEWNCGEPKGGDDAADAQFVDIKLIGNTLYVGDKKVELEIRLNDCGELDFDETRIVEDGVMAFDHAKIIAATLIYAAKCENYD